MRSLKKVANNIAFMFKFSWIFAKSRYIIAIIKILVNSFQPIFSLYMPKYIIDELTNEQRWDRVLFYIFLLVGINLTLSGIRIFINYIDGTSNYKNSWKYSKYYGRICSSIDYSILENSSKKDKMDQAINNAHPVNFIDNTVVGFFTNVIQLIGYTYIIITLHPLIIVLIVLLIVFSSLVSKKREKIGYQYQTIFNNYTRKFKYLFNALIRFDFGKEVRINNASKWLTQKFSHEIDDYMTDFGTSQKKYLKLGVADTIIAFIQMIIMYGYAAFRVVNKSITVGSFSVYLGAVTLFVESFRSLTTRFVSLGYLSKYVDDYKECNKWFESSENDIKEMKSREHEIEFINVSFKYPNTENYVLKNVSIKIKSGQKLSVVGYNGAGKTTFIKLICGFYKPTSGIILYDGIDITSIDPIEYRKKLSVVFQDFVLFYFSIKDNIAFNENIQKEKLYEAIYKSGLREKIDGLENGVDTPISKEFYNNGIEFSGGEGQKLACARAYYKDSPVIIFDEPTSALDPIAENQLYQRFNSIIKGKTAIYISHRLASVKFCDVVAVFSNGEIVEYGTHNELLSKNGTYSEMFKKQSQYYEEEN